MKAYAFESTSSVKYALVYSRQIIISLDKILNPKLSYFVVM